MPKVFIVVEDKRSASCARYKHIFQRFDVFDQGRHNCNPTAVSRIPAILCFSSLIPNSEAIPMRTLCLLLIGVVVGWAASDVDWSRDSNGQSAAKDDLFGEPASSGASRPGEPFTEPADIGEIVLDASGRPIPRYKLDAFNMATGNGYYIMDAMTGRLWYGTNGSKPQLIASELPEK
jgi:hypothetical protein